MYGWFALMALLALFIMAGAWYRISMPLFAGLWTLIYLMQKSDYNNHYYLMLLLCWLMCFMPAAARLSIDSWRHKNPVSTCPQWVPWLFIAQLLIIYFYAALNKIDSDWLSGRFIALQFAPLQTHRFVGPVYGNRNFQLFICYAGFLFDLLIIPLLLWKKTRKLAFACYVLFHLFNSFSFRIGIFPYLSVAMGLFVLDPEMTDKRLIRRFSAANPLLPANTVVSFKQKLLTAALITYLLFQGLVPLRYLLFPGKVFWTEEGYRMSWKMMARVKTGHIRYTVADGKTGQQWHISASDSFAPVHAKWMAIAPDIAWQYAQRLKRSFAARGFTDLHVYAIDSVKLNAFPEQLLIDSTVDLAAVPWEPFRHSKWILPLQEK